MPWMNARADLIGAHLLGGALGLVEREWPSAWDDALAVQAWEHWLITGRLAAYRAEWELEAGQLDDAVSWARRAIEMARGVHRRKYEAIALTVLGRALTAQGQSDAAATELGTAVEIADALGSPLLRWQARAAVGEGVVDRLERRRHRVRFRRRRRSSASRGRRSHPSGERLPRRAAGRGGPRGRRLGPASSGRQAGQQSFAEPLTPWSRCWSSPSECR
jgi:hypothetical protein